jgi:hypothetical protein
MHMKNDQIVSELVGIYGELSARINTCRAEQARLAKAMAAVQGVLQIYRPDMQLDTVPGSRPGARIQAGNARAALELLCTVDQPLTTREIAERILAQRGTPNPDPESVRRIIPSIAVTLRRNARKGLLSDGGCAPARWSVARAPFTNMTAGKGKSG